MSRRSSRNSQQRKYSSYEDEDDLDDFIVDDVDDQGKSELLIICVGSRAVSNLIKKMYGYNKYSYANEDEDDSNMEAGYDEIQREEFISRKLGRKEDELEYKRMLARGEDPDR